MRRIAVVLGIVLAAASARADQPVTAPMNFQNHPAYNLPAPSGTNAPTEPLRLQDVAVGACAIWGSGVNNPVFRCGVSGTDFEVPLTFSTGLHRSVNTITANLSTGVSGGQTAFGGTAASEALTLQGTTNATPGPVKVVVGTSAGQGLRIIRASDGIEAGEFRAYLGGSSPPLGVKLDSIFSAPTLSTNELVNNDGQLTITSSLDGPTGSYGITVNSAFGDGDATGVQFAVVPGTTQLSNPFAVFTTAGAPSFWLTPAGAANFLGPMTVASLVGPGFVKASSGGLFSLDTAAYLPDPGSNGIVVRTGSGTDVARSIAGTSGRVSVANGDGVSGNPTVDLSTVGTGGSCTNCSIAYDAYGRTTTGTTITVADNTVQGNSSGGTAAPSAHGLGPGLQYVTGVLGLTATAVSAATYTNATVIVGADGRITGASSGSTPEVPLTFSTGLHRATNTITANISTGVSGGQTAIGGTGATDGLTLQATSATPASGARIYFQTAFGNDYYDAFSGTFGMGNGTTAISLFKAADQFIVKTGGALTVGTNDAHSTILRTNGSDAVVVDSSQGVTLPAQASAGAQCAQFDSAGKLTGTGTACGTGSGGITSGTGDATFSGSGSVVVTNVNAPNGFTFAGDVNVTATAAPATPAAGHVIGWADSTALDWFVINSAGTKSHTAQSITANGGLYLTGLSDAGVFSTGTPTGDHKVMVDGSDTTADYLSTKIAATSPLVKTVVGGSTPAPPTSGLNLWLKADVGVTQSGSIASAWADQSGVGNNATVTTGGFIGAKVDTNVVNGLPGLNSFYATTVDMGGTGQILPNSSAYHMIAVVRSAPASAGLSPTGFSVGGGLANFGTGVMSVFGDYGGSIYISPFVTGTGVTIVNDTPYLFELISDGVTQSAFVNGTPLTLSSTVPMPAAGAGWRLFDDFTGSNGPYWGWTCEVLVYDRVLTGADLTTAYNYIFGRFGIGPGSGGGGSETLNIAGQGLYVSGDTSTTPQNLSALTTGLAYMTVTGGKNTFSTATAGVNYQAPLTACTDYLSLSCVSGGDLGGTNTTPTTIAVESNALARGNVRVIERTIPGPAGPGVLNCWGDTVSDNLECFTNTSVVKHMARSLTSTSSTYVTGLSDNGTLTTGGVATSDVTGWPTAGYVLSSGGPSAAPVGDASFSVNPSSHAISIGATVFNTALAAGGLVYTNAVSGQELLATMGSTMLPFSGTLDVNTQDVFTGRPAMELVYYYEITTGMLATISGGNQFLATSSSSLLLAGANAIGYAIGGDFVPQSAKASVTIIGTNTLTSGSLSFTTYVNNSGSPFGMAAVTLTSASSGTATSGLALYSGSPASTDMIGLQVSGNGSSPTASGTLRVAVRIRISPELSF